MKLLHLNLIAKWFNMVESGMKLSEYRDIKPYWIRKLVKEDYHEYTKDEVLCLGDDWADYDIDFKHYTHICFSNGYAKNRPQFTIELKGISIGTGKPEWGAIEGKQYFVLQLGEISDRKNISLREVK